MKKVLLTGSAGFIGGYLAEELLSNGYYVIGIDNLSKYGPITKSYDYHPNYEFVLGDCKDTDLLLEKGKDCEHFIAGAAMIGGISYFHKFAYDLLSENEKIIASTFDAAIKLFSHKLEKITVLSSSMVYENCDIFPTSEDQVSNYPPPFSTYGFQKLSTEYFAKGAYQQYGLPYTIIRPFNCIGIGEEKTLSDVEVKSGNINLTLSHVLPDLICKILKGQNPLHLFGNGKQIRHFTHGKDIARGIRLSLENKNALCNDFNISSDRSTTIEELAEIVWQILNSTSSLTFAYDEPFDNDIVKRIPDVSKAKTLLDFETEISLEDSVKEVVDWIKSRVDKGLM